MTPTKPANAATTDADTKPFLTDVTRLRAQARKQIDQGPVTAAYGADLPRVLSVLNDALATEVAQHPIAGLPHPGRRVIETLAVRRGDGRAFGGARRVAHRAGDGRRGRGRAPLGA